jgi:hypothetical protein
MFLEHWATLEFLRRVKVGHLEQQQTFDCWWVLAMKEMV